MGNNADYVMLLGAKLDLDDVVLESNPRWGEDGQDPYIVSSLSVDDYWNRYDDFDEEEIAKYSLGHVFPNGQIAQNLVANGAFSPHPSKDLTTLCFEGDDRVLGAGQLLGSVLLRHSSSDGCNTVDDRSLISALANKPKIAEVINAYGFTFQPEDIKTHQYMESDDY